MEYIYSRELINNSYNINNPERLDENLNNIFLSSEIEIGLPNKIFKIICNVTECKIIFDIELTTEEKNTLDRIVANHKQNI